MPLYDDYIPRAFNAPPVPALDRGNDPGMPKPEPAAPCLCPSDEHEDTTCADHEDAAAFRQHRRKDEVV